MNEERTSGQAGQGAQAGPSAGLHATEPKGLEPRAQGRGDGPEATMEQVRNLTASNSLLTSNVERLTGSNVTLAGVNRDLTAANTLLTSSNQELAENNTGLAGSNLLLTQENADLTASNTELDLFAHVLAHDLKEPVRGVRLLAQFIAEDTRGAIDEASAARLAQIDQLCERALTMVDVVLDAARLGSAPLRQEPVSVRDLFDEAVQGMTALIAENAANVNAEECCGRAYAYADRVQMARALRNLLTNALRHNPGAGKSVVVSVRERVDERGRDRQVTLTITDNGPGIPPEQAQKVFQMFRQLAPAEQGASPAAPPSRGTGAGLAIVKKIVERHGGRVWIEPRGDGTSGSVFCVALPRA